MNKREVVVLTNKSDLEKINKENILAVSIAEGGAMGVPGQLIILNRDNSLQMTKSCFDKDYLGSTLIVGEKIPELDKCEIDFLSPLTNKYEFVDGTWYYYNLGAGNHLFATEEFYKKYHNDFDRKKTTSERYTVWRNIICPPEHKTI